MIDEFSKSLMGNLIELMKAETEKGNPDYRTRLLAVKEARILLTELMPQLNSDERRQLSSGMMDQLEDVKKAMNEDSRLRQLQEQSKLFEKYSEGKNKLGKLTKDENDPE